MAESWLQWNVAAFMGDCLVVIGASGKWNDTPCIMWYEFMCKFTEAQPLGGKGNNISIFP